MNDRITQFERLWTTRPPLPRIMAFEPEPELRMPQACWLQRQTNEHASLSPRKKEQFWSAQTQAERDALLATISPVDLHMPLSDRYADPDPIELDEFEMTEELRDLMASWPVRTDCLEDTEVTEVIPERIAEGIYDPAIHIAPLTAPLITAPDPEDRLYALVAAAERMIADIGPPPALVRTITDLPRPPLVRAITDIGPGPGLQRSTNEHERLRPDLRERFWSADAEEKAELLATLSPIESSFPGLPALPPITAEEVEEILRSMRR